jgi:hypothetical protein
MTERGSRGRQFYSAWLPGPLAVLLGLGAHLASGGTAPAVPIVVALTALLSLSASILGRLRMPGWVLFVLCGLSQQILHLAFSALSGKSSGGPGGHGHGGPEPVSVPGLPGQPVEDLHLMVHAHLAGALLMLLVITQAGNVMSHIQSRRSRPDSARADSLNGDGRRGEIDA